MSNDSLLYSDKFYAIYATSTTYPNVESIFTKNIIATTIQSVYFTSQISLNNDTKLEAINYLKNHNIKLLNTWIKMQVATLCDLNNLHITLDNYNLKDEFFQKNIDKLKIQIKKIKEAQEVKEIQDFIYERAKVGDIYPNIPSYLPEKIYGSKEIEVRVENVLVKLAAKGKEYENIVDITKKRLAKNHFFGSE